MKTIYGIKQYPGTQAPFLAFEDAEEARVVAATLCSPGSDLNDYIVEISMIETARQAPHLSQLSPTYRKAFDKMVPTCEMRQDYAD